MDGRGWVRSRPLASWLGGTEYLNMTVIKGLIILFYAARSVDIL